VLDAWVYPLPTFDGPPPPAPDAGPTVAACAPPPEAASRWLAFDAISSRPVSNPDGGVGDSYERDIFLAPAAGGRFVRLTNGPGSNKDPAFSHDGTRLAFASNRSLIWEIYVLDLASGVIRQLTQAFEGLPPYQGDEPSWSFDDSRLVFRGGQTASSLFVINADGTNLQLVASGSTGSGAFYDPYEYPSLSADGSEILCDRENEIDAIKVDQSACPPFTGNINACFRYVGYNWTTSEETPALSPDGLNVAYSVGCAGRQLAVIPFDVKFGTLNGDAGDATVPSLDPCDPPKVPNTGNARRPAWGPGRVIAYEQFDADDFAASNTRLVLATVDAGPFCTLVPSAYARNPSWAPAGFKAP
jgi:hypothetical protein